MTSYVYRLKDVYGDLLYVGVAEDPQARIADHGRRHGWFGEVEDVSIDEFPTRAEAEAAERRAIIIERPAYNLAEQPSLRAASSLKRALNTATTRQPSGHPPQPGTSKVSINLTTETWDAFKAAAAEQGVWPAHVIEALFDLYLADDHLREHLSHEAAVVQRRRASRAAKIRSGKAVVE